MSHWKCTVCNYCHEGEAPPEKCPICKVPAEKFSPQIQPAPSKRKNRTRRFDNTYLSNIGDVMDKLHAHPISVHIPNGVLPVSVLFLLLAIILGNEGFATASFYNMLAVFLAMPVVILTGIISWQYKYRGALTPLFRGKLIAGAVVWITSGLTLFLQTRGDNALEAGQGVKLLVFILYAVLILASAYAGYLGGKLVFKR